MCFYIVGTCPYPHDDDISALIFNPQKKKGWRHCNERMPWGPLSCGQLTILHPGGGSSDKSTNAKTNEEMDLDTLETKQASSAEDEANSNYTDSMSTSIFTSDGSTSSGHYSHCPWCSATIKFASNMSKEVRDAACQTIDEVILAMKNDPQLCQLHQEINEMERAIESKRRDAWEQFNVNWGGTSAQGNELQSRLDPN